jgi:hypothetical protein
MPASVSEKRASELREGFDHVIPGWALGIARHDAEPQRDEAVRLIALEDSTASDP